MRSTRPARLPLGRSGWGPGQIGPFRATISYELEAAAGATRLVNNVELDPLKAVQRIAAPLATSRIKAAVSQNLAKLRQVLEAS